MNENSFLHGDVLVRGDASPFPGLHIGVAVFNVLPTGCMTLDEMDGLRAAQTSTAVGYAAPSLKFA